MSIVYFDVQIYEEKVSLLRTKNTCDKKSGIHFEEKLRKFNI